MSRAGPIALAQGVLLLQGAPPVAAQCVRTSRAPGAPAADAQDFWRPPSIAAPGLDAPRLAAAIRAAPEGVLLLTGALEAPFGAIEELFEQRFTPEAGARANAAYRSGTSRLIFKDSWGEGRCVSLIHSRARTVPLGCLQPCATVRCGRGTAAVLLCRRAARGLRHRARPALAALECNALLNAQPLPCSPCLSSTGAGRTST